MESKVAFIFLFFISFCAYGDEIINSARDLVKSGENKKALGLIWNNFKNSDNPKYLHEIGEILLISKNVNNRDSKAIKYFKEAYLRGYKPSELRYKSLITGNITKEIGRYTDLKSISQLDISNVLPAQNKSKYENSKRRTLVTFFIGNTLNSRHVDYFKTLLQRNNNIIFKYIFSVDKLDPNIDIGFRDLPKFITENMGVETNRSILRKWGIESIPFAIGTKSQNQTILTSKDEVIKYLSYR